MQRGGVLVSFAQLKLAEVDAAYASLNDCKIISI
jgi:hypothetical protein